MSRYTVAQDAVTEYLEKKSKFIAHAFYIPTVEDAQQRLTAVKRQYADATHNVWAYRIDDAHQKYSDDGEPQGTAGVPVLTVLKNSGLSNVLCVVTRYFGGVLLGAGGLVRAYSKAAALALDAAGKAEVIRVTEFCVRCSYSQAKTVLHLLEQYGAEGLKPAYEAQVAVFACAADDAYTKLYAKFRELAYLGVEFTELRSGFSRRALH